MRRTDQQLDQLLARGSVGGPAYDRIFEHVVEAVTERRRVRAIARVLVPVTALASVLSALALLGRGPSEPFRSKGHDLDSPVIEIGCARGARPVCHAGDTLMFQVDSSVVSGYLAAYAERVGNSDRHARIWYFPTEGEESPLVSAGPIPVVLERGIRIGAEH